MGIMYVCIYALFEECIAKNAQMNGTPTIQEVFTCNFLPEFRDALSYFFDGLDWPCKQNQRCELLVPHHHYATKKKMRTKVVALLYVETD